MIAQQELSKSPQTAAVSSMAALFLQRARTDGQRTAARVKKGGAWSKLTWQELADKSELAAFGLVAIGIQPGQMVGLIGATRIEWTICDLAVLQAGAIAVPIYHSNTADEIQFILDNSGSVAAFVEDARQLKKLVEARPRLQKIRKVIVMDGEGDGDWSISLQQLSELGKEQKAKAADELQKRVAAVKKDDLCTVLYTSGTTGVPKGVMITHDSMVFAAECIAAANVLRRDDAHLLFLPFAHSFAQVIKCSWFGAGYEQIFAESVDRLVDNAGETSPTILSAVPRVFEKAFNNVVAGGMANTGLQGKLFRMALREFEAYAAARDKGEKYSSLGFTIAKKLVFPKIHAKLSGRFGGRISKFVSGGAPLARKIAYFFELLGFDVMEGYGLTETMALTSINLPGAIKVGTVGRAFPGVEVKLAEDGEILERGRQVMRGYLGLPEATAEVIDKDGWFHTGDIGEIDNGGYLRITDRKKDLIKTSGGKYIAPQAIEGALKTMSELISQVVVIGDRRKYVSVLLTVVEDVAKKAAAAAGEGAATYKEASQSKTVHAKVSAAVDKLNATLPSYETVKKFTILDRDFSQESGELTPTLKVKRKAATQKYKAQIDAMYDGESLD
jgi:long-chain acyl-CoA synthetase